MEEWGEGEGKEANERDSMNHLYYIWNVFQSKWQKNFFKLHFAVDFGIFHKILLDFLTNKFL